MKGGKIKKIYLVEPLKPEFENRIAQFGELRRFKSWSNKDILADCKEADAIIIRTKGRITAEIIAAASNLKVIGRHGVGVDHIDLAAAAQNGVTVVNTPESNFNAVAEYIVGTVILLMRNIQGGSEVIKKELPWNKADHLIGRELKSSTVGLVGFGHIGQRVGEILWKGFGTNIVYWDHKGRSVPAAKTFQAKLCTIEELAAVSDIVSVHVPSVPETEKMINNQFFEKMNPHAFFVNTSRGAVVDQSALIKTLQEKRIAGAVLDVMTPEPLTKSPLQTIDNVILTPHMSAYTKESFDKMGEVVEDIRRVLNGLPPMFSVVYEPTQKLDNT